MSLEEDMRNALTTFVEEARELLQDLEDGLLGLESETDPTETVNAVFRAAHTIKGSSGLFGLDNIVRFTHVLESVLDRLRTNEIAVSDELVGSLLPCADHLGTLIGRVATGQLDESPDLVEQGDHLVAGLQVYLGSGKPAEPAGTPDPAPGTATPEPTPEPASAVASEPEPEPASAVASGMARLHLSLRFGEDCLRGGLDPLAFIRYLSGLGDVVALTTLDDLLPPAEELDPESCYLDFEVTMDTQASRETISQVFDFVADESDIRILGHQDPVEDYADLVRAAGDLGPRIQAILVATGAVPASAPAAELGESPATPAAPSDGDAALPPAVPVPSHPDRAPADPSLPAASQPAASQPAASQPVPAQPVPAQFVPAQPAASQPALPGANGRDSRTIRIDATRLDRLIDAVGELVIAGASAGLRASQMRDEALVASVGEVMRLVEEVRDSALQLRMVPIGTTFSRFQRVVHDVSTDLGKDIGLAISGADTEVDKALVEQIGDPLMHLVRNSMDHGIEPPEVRAARGKPARGTVRLNAFHDSGSIVIEVGDDGGGIDTQRVLAKAIDSGLVEPGVTPTEQEICNLIFEPGFSTAEQVSSLSGRGVGMDVVKRNVSALRGSIDVENRPGQGSTMRIRLPLTLAIIDGFLVGVGGASFVIPLDQVIECVELPATAHGRECMDLRGEVLPFIELHSLFGISGEGSRRKNVVVVEYAGMKIGLVVDALMGEFQTVIKPLSRVFEHVHGVGGSTILGNGDVALIIDVPMLVRDFGDRQAAGMLVASGRE